jgi:hypothetical protein
MKTILTMAAVLSIGLLATPALADDTNGYGVATSAATGQYLDNYGGVATSVAAYRTAQDSSFNYTRMGDVAPVGFSNCGSGGNPNCSASQGGTTGPGFNQTFSNSTSGMNYNGGLVDASTYANLGTGKLGGSGSTSYYQTVLTVAQFVDTLNFSIAGAENSTTTNIIVKFQLDGELFTPDAHGAPGLGTPNASIADSFGFGGANASVNFYQAGANSRYGVFEQQLTQSNSQTGWVSHSWDIVSPGLTQFTGVYALSGISQTVGIRNVLSAYAATGASFNYGSTSSLNLILPDNVTFTSASGVFLSDLPTSGTVPEPASWALMIGGFGMAGAMIRRRRAFA